MLIQLLADNPLSWIMPYVHTLQSNLEKLGHKATIIHKHDDVVEGDILCLLSCEQIFKKLELNKHNLVVHESALPQGKGWSPMTWQILEGKNEIVITLFEASNQVDSGVIYLQDTIKFSGTELIDEIRKEQGEATIRLITSFVIQYPNINGKIQTGESSYYPRRQLNDSMLDINKSLAEQFNLLRVVDNEKYPAFFMYKGVKYKITISKF